MQNLVDIQTEIEFIKKCELDFNCQSDELKGILVDFLSQKSKYIRSTVACLLFKSMGIELSQSQLYVLVATELIHNASLIHDDAIDESETRRNKISLNMKFNNKLAIISGDYLLSLANKYILMTKSFEVVENFSNCIGKMCIGESNQYFERYKIPSMDNYIDKTTNKTAELFKALIMSIYFLAKENVSIDIESFARNFGIAFQIRNDLDDYMKKDCSTDIKDGVYTAPVILGHSIDYNVEAIEKTLNLIHNYSEKAKFCIKDIQCNEYNLALVGIIDKLCNPKNY